MNKRVLRAGVWLVLIAIALWILAESRRGPDYVGAALKQVPADCAVQGVWRREDYPKPIANLKNTLILCQTTTERHLWTVYDDGAAPYSLVLDADGASQTTGDVFTINDDGTLTISDQDGEYITVQPAKH